jgi:alkylation response protein AidB-like acyl-CoA dehydrogenase
MQSTLIQNTTYSDFLDNFKKSLNRAFYEIDDISKFTQQRGFPDPVLKEIMNQSPLSVAIPTEYGGRGVKVKECLGLLEAASYESLALSLTFGINIALFLEPVAKYGQDSMKEKVFQRFINQQNMGGLMITEPDFGSDALNMQTSCEPEGDGFRIKGTKHWQGLTGMADYWLMTCRSKNEQGELGRDLDFFITDEQAKGQDIKVTEYFNNIGLYPIPYGRNEVDVLVPQENKLIPESTGLKLMMDLLHRSRLQFPGMAIGFVKRMLDEAVEHCNKRFVSGKPLIALDQVKFRISQLQSAFTVASSLCFRSSKMSGIEENVAGAGIEANCMKAYATDLMQRSAQTVTQLKGANGYKMESYAGRGIMDSRPFQVFEGSNEMLYTQISEMVLKIVGRKKFTNLADFIPQYKLTENVASYFKSIFNFNIDFDMPQRKLVDLGKALSRVVCANHVIELGKSGFKSDLIESCLTNLVNEANALISNMHNPSTIVDDSYNENSSWLSLV